MAFPPFTLPSPGRWSTRQQHSGYLVTERSRLSGEKHVVGKVGDIVRTRGEVALEWKIHDFFSLADKVDICYHSPAFSFAGSRWYLRLYASGETGKSSPGFTSLYLVIEDPEPPKTTYFTLGIKGPDGVDEKAELKFEFFQRNKGYGYSAFWSRSELKNRKSTLMPNNVLTITCNLRSDALVAAKGEKKVLKSLLSVLESGDDSDVVLKVQGKEFPAHRVILRARSPVFSSMFSHDMAEKQSNVVTIEDCDPEAFPDFLVHIYSGSCEHISATNVCSLYTAADKYDVGELKEACTVFMSRNLTVACFCDVFAVAVTHDEKDLMERTTKFFLNKSSDIVKTDEWKTFLKENSTVANELIIKALPK